MGIRIGGCSENKVHSSHIITPVLNIAIRFSIIIVRKAWATVIIIKISKRCYKRCIYICSHSIAIILIQCCSVICQCQFNILIHFHRICYRVMKCSCWIAAVYTDLINGISIRKCPPAGFIARACREVSKCTSTLCRGDFCSAQGTLCNWDLRIHACRINEFPAFFNFHYQVAF